MVRKVSKSGRIHIDRVDPNACTKTCSGTVTGGGDSEFISAGADEFFNSDSLVESTFFK